MDPFAQQVQEWQPFYGTVATACATLMGLLFVSLSLNVDILNREENERLLRLAWGSFGDFLYVLMISIIFLVPRQIPMGMVVALFTLISRGAQALRALSTKSCRSADLTRAGQTCCASLGSR